MIFVPILIQQLQLFNWHRRFDHGAILLDPMCITSMFEKE